MVGLIFAIILVVCGLCLFGCAFYSNKKGDSLNSDVEWVMGVCLFIAAICTMTLEHISQINDKLTVIEQQLEKKQNE